MSGEQPGSSRGRETERLLLLLLVDEVGLLDCDRKEEEWEEEGGGGEALR